MSETIPERTPEQIIGHDNLMQLIFEGYEVVRAGAILSERDRATAAERARCTGLAEDAAEQALRAFGGFTATNAAAFMEGKFRSLLAAIRNPMEGRG